MKIIIVDDNQVIRDILKIFIEKDRELSVIYSAENGKIAYKKIIEMEPDLVITDIDMPIMNGLEMIENLNKKLGEYVPEFIVITGNLERTLMEKCFLLGVNDFIKKPFVEEDLISKIKSHI